MSTKIYEGFRFKTDSIAEVLASLAPFKAALAAHEELQRSTFLSHEAVRILDQRIVKPKPFGADDQRPRSPLDEAEKRMKERQGKMRAEFTRDPEVDFEVKLVCFFSERMQSIIGYVIAEDGGFAHSELLKLDLVEDFGYWNNTDQPDDVSEADWDLRSEAWNDTFKKGATMPFELTFGERYFWPNKEQIFELVPPFEKRCSRLAFDEVLNQWFLETVPEEGRTGDAMWRDGMRHYFEFRDLAENDETIKARLTIARAEIAEKLPQGEELQKQLTSCP